MARAATPGHSQCVASFWGVPRHIRATNLFDRGCRGLRCLVSHVFVDESMRRNYLLCAAVVAPDDLEPARRAVRAMLAKGQRRLHFVDESPQRRRAILSSMTKLDVRVRIYTCGAGERAARRVVMSALVADLRTDVRRLVIESRGARDRDDRQLLVELHKAGVLAQSVAYEHLPAHAEPLLWIADAVAWAYGNRQPWRSLVEPIVESASTIERREPSGATLKSSRPISARAAGRRAKPGRSSSGEGPGSLPNAQRAGMKIVPRGTGQV